MKSVMTAGMEFGKQLTEQNPEMAEVMGFDGSQVQFLVPYCTGEKYLTLHVPYHNGEKSLALSHRREVPVPACTLLLKLFSFHGNVPNFCPNDKEQ